MARGDQKGTGRGHSGDGSDKESKKKRCETCDKTSLARKEKKWVTLCDPYRFGQDRTCGKPKPDEGFY